MGKKTPYPSPVFKKVITPQNFNGDATESVAEDDSLPNSTSQYDLSNLPKFDLLKPYYQITDAPIQNGAEDRRANAYLAVILQFGVDQNPCHYTMPCDGGKNELYTTPDIFIHE